MATILTKKSDTSSSVPLAADLTNAAGGAELAVNTADKRLYSKTSGGSVVELGTNPSALSLPNGTANGVPYLNGSKVLTSGSALTFDGTTLTNTSGAFQGYDNLTLTAFVNGTNGTVVNINSAGTGGITKFSINGSEAMRLTSTGLGIGTSGPTQKLDVAGNIQARSGTVIADIFTNYGTNLTFNSGGSLPMIFQLNGSEAMRLDPSGNLGLGVTPSAWLSNRKVIEVGGSFSGFSGSANTGIYNNAYTNTSSVDIYKNTGVAAQALVMGSTGGFAFYTAPSGTAGNAISFTQAMTLDASGNLLLGVTSGVGGTPPSAGFIFERNGNIKFRTNGDNSFTQFINSSGGQTGGITTNGTSTAYNTSSDYRLKTVIGSVTGSGERIDALEPIEYEWKVNGERTRGFLAHKFQEVYAGSVTGSKDAVDKDGKPVYQAMQAGSSEVIADLVAEIQSLRKRLAALESK